MARGPWAVGRVISEKAFRTTKVGLKDPPAYIVRGIFKNVTARECT